MHSLCSSFVIYLAGKWGKGYSRVGGELVGFLFLVILGGQCIDNDSGVNGPATASPHPRCVPAHSSLEILGTMTILSGLRRYSGRWPVGMNQKVAGTVRGRRGGGNIWQLCVRLKAGSAAAAAAAESGGSATSN